MKKYIIPLILSILLINAIDDIKNVYSDIRIVEIPFKEGFIDYYFFDSTSNVRSDTLFIYIDGSGPVSVLGKGVIPWTVPYIFREELRNSYDLLVPERPDTKPGDIGKGNSKDKSLRIEGYAAAINHFLKINTYKNVCLVGFSEGGILLPEIYEAIVRKDIIKGLVIMGAGSLSLYECFKIQINKPDLPFHSRDSLRKVERLLTKPRLSEKDKIWLDYYTRDPMPILREIDIPILVLHGETDTNCPVESSRYLFNEFIDLGKTNLTYKEYRGWDHGFNGNFSTVIADITDWFKVSGAE